MRDQNILVVEANPFIAMDLQGVFEGACARATVIGPAHDMPDALWLIARSSICAAVLDYRLEATQFTVGARACCVRHAIFVSGQ